MATPKRSAAEDGMVRIEGGAFRMGSEDFYPEERPVREVSVAAEREARGPVVPARGAGARTALRVERREEALVRRSAQMSRFFP